MSYENMSFSFMWQLALCHTWQSGIYVQLSFAISHLIYSQITGFSRISVQLQLHLRNEQINPICMCQVDASADAMHPSPLCSRCV